MQGRLESGMGEGNCWKLYKNDFLLAIQCFLILAGPEIPQKSFSKFPKSLEGLLLSILLLLHTWVLADDKTEVSLIERYLDT